MNTRFVEVTDGFAYGKMLVGRLDFEETFTRTAMPEAPRYQRLLTYSGLRYFNERTTLVIDLQRGTGAAWPLENGTIGCEHYLRGKLQGLPQLVCPMYFPFVVWLHVQGKWANGAGEIADIPRYIDFREELRRCDQCRTVMEPAGSMTVCPTCGWNAPR